MRNLYRRDLNTVPKLEREIRILEKTASTKMNTNHRYDESQAGDFTSDDALRMIGKTYDQIAAEFNISEYMAKQVYNAYMPESSPPSSAFCLTTHFVGKRGHDYLHKQLVVLRNRLRWMSK